LLQTKCTSIVLYDWATMLKKVKPFRMLEMNDGQTDRQTC